MLRSGPASTPSPLLVGRPLKKKNLTTPPHLLVATKKKNLFFDFPKLPSIIMSTKVSTVCLQKSKANKMYEVVRKFWLKKETSSQPEHE